MRSNTRDRGSPDPPKILVTEKLGPKQALTREGFLLCEEVPIARIGRMLYGAGEVPIETGPNGIVWVTRSPEDLFSEVTLASGNGKAVVDEHPDDGIVDPSNWADLARGHMFNVRRGEGEFADCLIADLLITDAALIKAVQSGKREVSCGYEADYEDLGDGNGVQSNIIINHLALVERGRCGPRCAIGDHQPNLKELQLTKKRVTVPERIRQIFKDAGESLAAEMTEGTSEDLGTGNVDDDGASHTHIHIHNGNTPEKPNGSTTASGTGAQDDAEGGEGGEEGNGSGEGAKNLESRVAGLEASVQQILKILQGGGGDGTGDSDDDSSPDEETQDEAPAFLKKGDEQDDDEEKEVNKEGKAATTKDGKGVTQDSAALATNYQQLLADAEILVPGFKVPTFDAKLPRKQTVDSMCKLRRKALDAFSATAEGAAAVDGLFQGDLDKLDCGGVALIFKAAAGVKKAANNKASVGDAGRVAEVHSASNPLPAAATIADLNKKNREYWSKRSAS
jgi:hypothetical protein